MNIQIFKIYTKSIFIDELKFLVLPYGFKKIRSTLSSFSFEKDEVNNSFFIEYMPVPYLYETGFLFNY